MHGAHWLEGWSVTQKGRALSSGESEFYAQGSGAARGLLIKHICHEAGEATKTLIFHFDAHRLGAGKCRHIEVKWLWLQQAMYKKTKLATKHVSSESNVADFGTKGWTSDRIWKLMNLMGTSLVAGEEFLEQQPMETNTGDVES